VRGLNLALGAANSNTGDGQADAVIVNGTNGNDNININGSAVGAMFAILPGSPAHATRACTGDPGFRAVSGQSRATAVANRDRDPCAEEDHDEHRAGAGRRVAPLEVVRRDRTGGDRRDLDDAVAGGLQVRARVRDRLRGG